MPDGMVVSGGFTYPTVAAFQRASCYIEKELSLDNDFLLSLMPFRYEPNADMIVFQYQNIFCGVQQWRGIGNSLPIVPLEDVQRECVVYPGYWGEETYLDEIDLTRRAVRQPPNGCPTPVDITDLVSRRQKWLMVRRYNLIRKLIADSLVFGQYEAIDQRTGAVLQKQKYNINEVLPVIPWSDTANAKPFIDLMDWRNYYEQTTFHKFGCCARMIMNRKTYSYIIRNTNMENWRSIRGEWCCVNPTLANINQLLCDMDLPQIVVYNESYFECDLTRGPLFSNSTGSAQRRFYIPDGMAVIVGCGDAPSVGNFWFTRNANTCDDAPMAGPVTQVIDQCQRPPRRVSVLDYWNGGPALECPKAIISAIVK